MIFEFCAIAVGILAGLWRKGSLWNISNISVRYVWLLPIGYLLESYSISHLTGHLYETCLIVSYVLILVFCVINIRKHGIPWTTIGTGANFACMLANGLRMPAYIPSIRSISPTLVPLLYKGEVGKSIGMTARTHLNFLGDIFTFRLYSVTLISIGDILFGVGLVVFLYHAMCPQKEVQTDVARFD